MNDDGDPNVYGFQRAEDLQAEEAADEEAGIRGLVIALSVVGLLLLVWVLG